MQSEFFVGPGFGFGVLKGVGNLTGGVVVVITGFVAVGSTVGFGVSPLPMLSVGEGDGCTDGVAVGVLVAETVEVGVGVTLSVVPLLA